MIFLPPLLSCPVIPFLHSFSHLLPHEIFPNVVLPVEAFPVRDREGGERGRLLACISTREKKEGERAMIPLSLSLSLALRMDLSTFILVNTHHILGGCGFDFCISASQNPPYPRGMWLRYKCENSMIFR